MKGAQGLMIAAGLGVVGAVCNWFYISRKAADLEKEEFVYVKASAKVRAGDPFKLEDFGKIEIPKKFVGDLDKTALRWEDPADGRRRSRATAGFPKTRFLLQSDTRRLPQKALSQALGPDEISWPVVVDPTRFVAENYNPGDMVLFFPPPASQVRDKNARRPSKAGPFRILRIGDRGGSGDIYRAGGRRTTRSNVITVPLLFKNGKFDKKSQELLDLMEYAGGQGLEASVQSAQKKDAGR